MTCTGIIFCVCYLDGEGTEATSGTDTAVRICEAMDKVCATAEPPRGIIAV